MSWSPTGGPPEGPQTTCWGGTHKPQSANSGEVCPRWCCLIINGSRKVMTHSYSHTFGFCADSISQNNTNSLLSVSSDHTGETQSCFKLDSIVFSSCRRSSCPKIYFFKITPASRKSINTLFSEIITI